VPPARPKSRTRPYPRADRVAPALVMVGPRDALMTKLIRRALPDDRSRVKLEASPQNLLASFGGAEVAPMPAMYVFNTAMPSTDARRLKGIPVAARISAHVGLVRAQNLAWIDALRALRAVHPTTPVLVVIDNDESSACDGLLNAGADEVITLAALGSPAVVKRRIASAFAHARANRLLPTVVIEADDAPSETQITAGLDTVRAAVTPRTRDRDRRVLVSDLLAITVPDLRASSGRLDAQRIAKRMGVSLNTFAAGMPVSREALRTNPDSKRIQHALDPYARALAVLDTLLPDDSGRQWLNTRHPRFGSTPLDTMVAGRADAVARLLELAREGDVD